MMLLDSNVVIALAAGVLCGFDNRLREEGYAISVITRIEVLGYHRLSEEEKSDLVTFLRGGDECPLDERVTARAIVLRQLRKMTLGDSIIAATALVQDLPLVTRNTRDFRHTEGLRLINPFGQAEDSSA